MFQKFSFPLHPNPILQYMELRERIVSHASTLFFQKGIRSVSMSDIANDLGISKRTLYEVFRDKEELLEECIDKNMEEADREFEILINDSENVIDTLMRIYAKHLNDVKNINKSVIHDLKKYHPRLHKKIEDRQKEGVDTFIPLFQRAVEQGLMRDDINFEILLWLLKSQFKILLEDEYMPTDKFSTQEFVRAIILNFTRGIATAKGDEKIEELMVKYNNNNKKQND